LKIESLNLPAGRQEFIVKLKIVKLQINSKPNPKY